MYDILIPDLNLHCQNKQMLQYKQKQCDILLFSF